MRASFVLFVLLTACGGSAASSDNGGSSGGEAPPPSEAPLHAFVREMCAEADRVATDPALTDDDRRAALEAWGDQGNRRETLAELGRRGEAVGGDSQIARMQTVLSDVAPDVACDAFFGLARSAGVE